MGRLFWKFFAFIWLTQLTAIGTITIAFWLTDMRFDRALSEIDFGPGAGPRVDAAAAILRYSGLEAFKQWSATETGPKVYAVDPAGHDVLGRPVTAELVSHAQHLQDDRRGPEPVRELSMPDGQRYLLFAAAPPAGRTTAARSLIGGPSASLVGGGGPPGPGGPEGARGPRAHHLPVLPLMSALVVSLAAALMLAWYMAKPIRSLRTAFEAAAGGDLNVRAAPAIGGRKDELADLGRDFDRMAHRLQASMNGQRRLLHDVSHEMRSPLARLQAATGLIRLKFGQQEPAIERIEEEIVRIDRLVGDLLTLSRLEAGELGGAEEEIDMQELLHEILADANFEAQALGRRVVWDQETPGSVRGRPAMLHGAIENVIRNAFKHAPQSQEIQVATAIGDGGRTYGIRVLDSGPGVPEGELPGLFTPFFRAADSAKTEGYGLGLAIARRSIEAHRGSISASNRGGGGLAVSIVLPVGAPPTA